MLAVSEKKNAELTSLVSTTSTQALVDITNKWQSFLNTLPRWPSMARRRAGPMLACAMGLQIYVKIAQKQNYLCAHKQCLWKNHPTSKFILPTGHEAVHHPMYPAALLKNEGYCSATHLTILRGGSCLAVLNHMRVARTFTVLMHNDCHKQLDRQQRLPQKTLTDLWVMDNEQKKSHFKHFEPFLDFPSYFHVDQIDPNAVPLGCVDWLDPTDTDVHILSEAVKVVKNDGTFDDATIETAVSTVMEKLTDPASTINQCRCIDPSFTPPRVWIALPHSYVYNTPSEQYTQST